MSTSSRASLRALFLLATLSSVPALGCADRFSTVADQGGDDASDENPGIPGVPLDGAKDDAADSAASAHPDARDDAPDAAQDATTEGGEALEGAAESAVDSSPPMEAATSETGAPCAPPNLQCSAGCVPNDVHNCGTCGHDCTDLPHVSGPVSCTASGACAFPQSSCAQGWAACGSDPDLGCNTDLSQAATCGSCTTVCPTNDPVCSGSGGSYSCVSGCTAPDGTLCSGTCVDTATNPSYCGNCSTSCAGVTYGQPACAGSMCSITCNSGYSGCPTAAPTACVDEQDDPSNCGSCNNTCPQSTNGGGAPACAGGACGLTCNSGLTACPVAGPTECDNTTNDLDDCGSCGNKCTTSVANANPTCQNSQCGFVCDPGYLLCNGTSCIGPDPNGLFVSPSGSGTTCTSSAPCATIAAALSVATQTGKSSIYLDQGTYAGFSLGATSVAIHGGWTYSSGAGTWTNCNGTDSTSVVVDGSGTTVAVAANASGAWTLDTLTINIESLTPSGWSVFAVIVQAGDLSLTNVDIDMQGGGGGSGASVGQGSSGTAATGTSCTASDGANGSPGAAGTAGSQGAYTATGFTPGSGGQGSPGATPGDNGTTPGSPPCDKTIGCCLTSPPQPLGCVLGDCGSASGQCGGAANAGCGGGVGGGGPAGNGGGSSVGILVSAGVVTLSGVSVTTAAGGAGGNGGAGGPGGSGSTGSNGTPVAIPTSCHIPQQEMCTPVTTSEYASGTTGGTGGAGGQGGGGAGGDSLCYVTTGTGTVSGAPSCAAGAGGAGGNQGLPNVGATGRSGMHN
jgi:hypothetical protein